MRIIRNKRFISMLNKAGFDVILEEDSGTIYVYGNTNDVQLYDNAWCGAHFKSQSPEQWVLDIAIRYFEEGDYEDIISSKGINPNFGYLYQLANSFINDNRIGNFYINELNKYIIYFK